MKNYKFKHQINQENKGNDKYLNLIPIKLKEGVKIEPIHTYLIFDRSGSMGYHMNAIVESAISYCKQLPDMSQVSLGYFSGDDQYNLSVPYTLQKEINGAVTTLDSYRNCLGLTNFIQILDKVKSTVGEGKASMFFFTDGCHNSGGTKSQVLKVLEELAPHLQIVNIVGYGNYIDRDMLAAMANKVDGQFIHLSEFKEFSNVLSAYGETVKNSLPTIKVKLPSKPISPVIAITNSGAMEYAPDENLEISYKPINDKKFNGVYYVSETPVGDEADLDNISIERGIRALAYIYSTKNDAEKAMEIIHELGDVFLVNKFYTAISPDEFARAEAEVLKSVFNPKDRFKEGLKHNSLPAPDALCVLDVLNALSADNEAKMYLRDKDFSYEKIGSPSKQTDGSKFIYPEDAYAKLSGLVGHAERLNISILATIKGHVDLDPAQFSTGFTTKDLEDLGIRDKYPVIQYRNYSIISDGRLHTSKIVVGDLSEETYGKIKPVLFKREDGKYVVDFTSLPLLNKNYVSCTSANVLAVTAWNEKLLSSELSVVNYLKKLYTDKTEGAIEGPLNEQRDKFLKEKCYIDSKAGAYNPPVDVVKGGDEYQAYTFKVSFKGYSSVTPKAVVAKVEAGKPCTEREQIMASLYSAWKSHLESKSLEEKLDSLNQAQKGIKTEVLGAQGKLQQIKFAIILGNKGKMDEFDSRENMVLKDCITLCKIGDTKFHPPVGVTAEFEIKEITVKI
mgnify:CR=1 FL=1